MKFTKMSLVAALLVGSSAFAIENVKVSGDAKLYYATAKEKTTQPGVVSATTPSLFTKDASMGQAALGLGLTADLAKGISAGLHATVLSSLGLENSLVSGTWAGNIQGNPNGTPGTGNGLNASNGTAWWVDQAWIAGTLGKTTAKVGRMELDTPLAFTEKWNIAENTFEAAVLINQDIPDTTLVAAFVGGSNGDSQNTVANAQDGKTPFRGYTAYNSGAEDLLNVAGFGAGNQGFGGAGAYGFGVVNNSIKALTLQAWYYDVKKVADAYWLQADANIEGILVGAQYANMKLHSDLTTNGLGAPIQGNVNVDTALAGQDNFTKTTDAYALMVGYDMKDVATIKAAYSQVADNGILSIQNTATGNQSKLYTEAWWGYGVVGQSGAKSYMLNAETKAVGIDFLAQYTHADVKHKRTGTNAKAKADEFALVASKTFGPLDTTLAYVYSKATNTADNFIHNQSIGIAEGTIKSNMIQAYLTLNF